MTTLLMKAFDAAAKLPADEQDLLASRLLAELAVEDEFDRKIASTAGRLTTLAQEAIAEQRTGLAHELDPEQL